MIYQCQNLTGRDFPHTQKIIHKIYIGCKDKVSSKSDILHNFIVQLNRNGYHIHRASIYETPVSAKFTIQNPDCMSAKTNKFMALINELFRKNDKELTFNVSVHERDNQAFSFEVNYSFNFENLFNRDILTAPKEVHNMIKIAFAPDDSIISSSQA